MNTSTGLNNSQVNPIEKRVVAAAIFFAATCMGLLAYATWGLGINVPTCVPDAKNFDRGSVTKLAEKTYELHYLASMWKFEPVRVTVPAGSTLDIYVTSKDVTHGLQVLGTNVNLMAVPGAVTSARVRFSKPGIYALVCHEYCGAAHQNMSGAIEVSDKVTEISAEGLAELSPGRKILDDQGCLACHSLDGTAGIGPSFKGLWGQTVELTDGLPRKVDENFVKQKIQDPDKNHAKGFEPVMPKLPVSDEEIRQIEEFLKELR
jgi:cytochrome c oxidase subunit II